LFSLLPGVSSWLQYDRTRVVSDGEWWRIVSAQLVHWNARMAIADLGTVVLLGLWAETRMPRATRAVLLAGLPLIGIGIHLGAPRLLAYRGSSGLATALFVLVALSVATDTRRRAARALAVVALVLVALKVSREVWTGTALFAGPLPDGVEVAPLAHVLGAVLALMVVLAGRAGLLGRGGL
jgi:rhomboid family GlyGly-CTERM serine protease